MLETKALYMPDMQACLVSPQAFIKEKGNHRAKLIVEYQEVTFRIAPDKALFIR